MFSNTIYVERLHRSITDNNNNMMVFEDFGIRTMVDVICSIYTIVPCIRSLFQQTSGTPRPKEKKIVITIYNNSSASATRWVRNLTNGTKQWIHWYMHCRFSFRSFALPIFAIATHNSTNYCYTSRTYVRNCHDWSESERERQREIYRR